MAVLQETALTPVRVGAADIVGWSRQIGRGVLLPLGFAILATIAWEILCRVTRISPLLLPPPSAVWEVLSENSEILLQHAVPTTIETVVSFGLATLLGIALAVAITFSALGARGALSEHRDVPAHPEDRAGAAFHRVAGSR